MTEPVMEKMRENNIKLVRVPPNITNIFQPLDLTVYGAAKAYLKSKFTEWYFNSIVKQLDEGKIIEDIDVKLKKKNFFKLLHVEWIKDLYNYLTSEKNRTIISNVWKVAFITETTKRLSDENAEYFITPSTEIEDENGRWELEGELINNIFYIIDDL